MRNRRNCGWTVLGSVSLLAGRGCCARPLPGRLAGCDVGLGQLRVVGPASAGPVVGMSAAVNWSRILRRGASCANALAVRDSVRMKAIARGFGLCMLAG